MSSDDDSNHRHGSNHNAPGRPQPARGDRRQGYSGGSRSSAGSNYGDWRPHDRAANAERDDTERPRDLLESRQEIDEGVGGGSDDPGTSSVGGLDKAG